MLEKSFLCLKKNSIHWNIKIKLNSPNIGYSLVIRVPNPNWEIKRARLITIKIAFLNFILNVCSRVFAYGIYVRKLR